MKRLAKKLLLCALLFSAAAFSQTPLDSRLAVLDPIINDAIAQQLIPGAVVVIGHDGQVVYRKAYGSRAIDPRREAMTLDTVFDCASLTKVVATTTAIMQLWEQGKFRMNDPVAKYLPEFGQNGKQDITIRQLLVHYSGLAPDLDLTKPWEGKETAYRMAFEGLRNGLRVRRLFIAISTSWCWERWWSGFRASRSMSMRRGIFSNRWG